MALQMEHLHQMNRTLPAKPEKGGMHKCCNGCSCSRCSQLGGFVLKCSALLVKILKISKVTDCLCPFCKLPRAKLADCFDVKLCEKLVVLGSQSLQSADWGLQDLC